MDWSPFRVCPPGRRPPKPRGLHADGGLADRLRIAAFAELQAREAFRWAASRWPAAPEAVSGVWLRLSTEEDRHLQWLLGRMGELGASPAERQVSDALWRGLSACTSAGEFRGFMGRAEDRARAAERSFERALEGRDPETAAIFRRIAADEDEHVRLAQESGGQAGGAEGS